MDSPSPLSPESQLLLTGGRNRRPRLRGVCEARAVCRRHVSPSAWAAQARSPSVPSAARGPQGLSAGAGQRGGRGGAGSAGGHSLPSDAVGVGASRDGDRDRPRGPETERLRDRKTEKHSETHRGREKTGGSKGGHPEDFQMEAGALKSLDAGRFPGGSVSRSRIL